MEARYTKARKEASDLSYVFVSIFIGIRVQNQNLQRSDVLCHGARLLLHGDVFAGNPFGILIGIGVPPHFFTVRQRKAVMDNAPMTAFGNLFEQFSGQTNDGLAHHHNHTDIHAAHRPFV